ncbi:MAG: glycosyltransferase family 4 protein [Deltaproteobacteria bacterium]|nr:glycosyltransferase family 4 protein [Deltaproteobacteria bacterium]
MRYAGNLADALADLADIRMIVSADCDRQLLPRKTQFEAFHTGRNSLYNLMYSLNPLSYKKILRRIRTFAPHAVLFPVEHLWHPLIQSNLKTFPIVQTIHDPLRHQGEENAFFDLIRIMSLLNADKVIVLSSIFKRSFEQMGLSQKDVHVIPHGAFAFSEGVLRNGQLAPPSLRKSILFVGRITRYKGLDILLKAFASVHKIHPEATLTIAGKGDLSPYRQLIENLENVRIFNHYLSEEELADLHEACDFVVAPYIDASQSGVVPMALANQRTVITTRVGGLPEQVEDGQTGTLVRPGDVEDLAGAMIRLLNHPHDVLRMSSLARERYLEAFGWDAIARRTYESCLSAIDSFRSRRGKRRKANFLFNFFHALRLYAKGMNVAKCNET